MANILILGGGFAGLVAAERLAHSTGPEHQITLVAPNRNFTFYPALVELAFGETEADSITFDLREKLDLLDVRFIQGELLRVNRSAQTAEITGDDMKGDLNYDIVVFAMGRRLATEKVSGFFEYSHHLLGVKAAKKFGDAVNDFKAGDIVLGVCPGGRLPVPVCETAFALARRFEAEIEAGTVTIKVIFPESLAAAFGGAAIHNQLEAAFAKHKINVLYDVPIIEITADEVISSEKHHIKHDLLMLVPPFRGQAIVRDLGITNEEDFVKVNDRMEVHGMDMAYAAGDLVAFSGPKFAHMAVRQAEVAAANILSELKGETPSQAYYHEIATVIDAGGPESIYLHYGVWDDNVYRIRQGSFWGWAKEVHDRVWRARHR
ncbi:MAG: NAD(P)/FAD-dependent oxidoreductase [Pyrinomonadaceae bacterium]